MLKKRLIPILLLKNGRMVKTVKFSNERDVGSPVTTAKIYDAQNVDEIVFLDILASSEGRKFLINVIDGVTKECFMPFTAGGGIKSIDDINLLLKAGADKVSVNTAAVENTNFIREAVAKFGSANIIASVDYKENASRKTVFTHGGKKDTGKEVLSWIKELEKIGVGEIILNNIDRDGTMIGYDIETVREVADAIRIPLIACGGAGKLHDFSSTIKDGHASAVAAGSIFHFTDQSPIKARMYLKNEKIDIRSDF
jgi:imidazole glycerol-phosphate synthase subunit HisF